MTRDANQSADETNARPNHYLREWRNFMGWSQEELAQMADVHLSKISRIENGKRELKAGFLQKLAGIFQAPASALLEVNPSTEDGARTARMFRAWTKLSGAQQRDMLRMIESLTGPDEGSNTG